MMKDSFAKEADQLKMVSKQKPNSKFKLQVEPRYLNDVAILISSMVLTRERRDWIITLYKLTLERSMSNLKIESQSS